jgi:hypothetical protein
MASVELITVSQSYDDASLRRAGLLCRRACTRTSHGMVLSCHVNKLQPELEVSNDVDGKWQGTQTREYVMESAEAIRDASVHRSVKHFKFQTQRKFFRFAR